MTRIKRHIFKVKLPFYPPCEVKYGLQNGVSTACITFGPQIAKIEEPFFTPFPLLIYPQVIYSP